ncbi:MAG: dUTP diphosphatase [Oscillospiraceae bacterium]
MGDNKTKILLLSSSASVPQRATIGSGAYDLRADISCELTILPGEFASIPTGIAIELPKKKYVALIFSRSGMGMKHGVALVNSVGVIDSDYRGEICVGLINHGKEAYTVLPNDRIAQMMFVKSRSMDFETVSKLTSTERGTGGFGSTGI